MPRCTNRIESVADPGEGAGEAAAPPLGWQFAAPVMMADNMPPFCSRPVSRLMCHCMLMLCLLVFFRESCVVSRVGGRPIHIFSLLNSYTKYKTNVLLFICGIRHYNTGPGRAVHKHYCNGPGRAGLRMERAGPGLAILYRPSAIHAFSPSPTTPSVMQVF